MAVGRKTLQTTILLTLTLVASFASCLEREILVASPWDDVALDGIRLKPGRWGLSDLVLDDGDYEVEGDTRLLLHLDSVPFRDATGSYIVTMADGQPGPMLASSNQKVFGEGSGAFQSGLSSLVLDGPPLLGAADFSIEFWLYPAHLSDGERVLSWNADRWNGREVSPQTMVCSLQGRTLQWRIDGAFLDQQEAMTIKGLTALVPREWAHHILRYDSGTGLLEYMVDGVPEAVVHLTSDGHDGSPGLLPLSDTPGRLTVGETVTGLIDELRVSHRVVQDPQLGPYRRTIGTAVSGPYDMGRAGSRLLRIDGVYREPGQTAVMLSYRIADDLSELRPTVDGPSWKQFRSGEALGEAVVGRFVQVKAELRPDAAQSPALSSLTIVYEPDLPPPPPAQIVALEGNETVTLRWRPVLQKDVAGYLVYYGRAPGRYSGEDSAEGRSPIDIGDVTSATLTGLRNGELYYFAVVTYDRSFAAHQSVFSNEVTARPSALGRGP